MGSVISVDVSRCIWIFSKYKYLPKNVSKSYLSFCRWNFVNLFSLPFPTSFVSGTFPIILFVLFLKHTRYNLDDCKIWQIVWKTLIFLDCCLSIRSNLSMHCSQLHLWKIKKNIILNVVNLYLKYTLSWLRSTIYICLFLQDDLWDY